jgi:hypothetical protein
MSQEVVITNYKDWNPIRENFDFKKPTKNQSGVSLNINFTYKDSKLWIKTPVMRAPFGIDKGMNEGYNLKLSFDGDSVSSQEFLSKCEEFDRTMIELGMDNAFEWGIVSSKAKKPSRDVVVEKYKPMVKQDKYPKTHPRAGEPKDFPPHLSLQLPQTISKNGEPREFKTDLYDVKKNLVPLTPDSVPKHGRCVALIYGGGWSTNAGYGVSWKAGQVMLFPRGGGLPPGKCMIDIEEMTEGEFLEIEEGGAGGAETKSETMMDDEHVEEEIKETMEESEVKPEETEAKPEETEEIKSQPETTPVTVTASVPAASPAKSSKVVVVKKGTVKK